MLKNIVTKHKKIYFYLGLIIFYLIIFFAPNKPIYFAAYFIATYFFYLASKDLRLSLLFSLILSFFFDIGLAASWFILEPWWLKLGSGYYISPATIFILLLIPLSLNRKIKSQNFIDVVILLFFLWNAIFIIFFPYKHVLFGVIALGELLLAYYLLRLYMTEGNIHYIINIILSTLFFQSIISSFQFIFQRNVGILVESALLEYPYGVTTAEENLFRTTGTFGHPNFFASYLLVVYPFLLIHPSKSNISFLCRFFFVIIFISTLSRVAWALFFLIWALYIFRNRLSFFNRKHLTFKKIPLIISGFLFLYFFCGHYFIERLRSLPQIFEKTGSMNIRIMLLQEGLNIVSKYPITGIGFNRSLIEYFAYPVTNINKIVFLNSFYRIHNTFLEIAAEIGLPGFFLFLLFIYLVLKNYISKSNYYPKTAAFWSFVALFGISLFNPFFHSSQFRFYFLLAAIILT